MSKTEFYINDLNQAALVAVFIIVCFLIHKILCDK